MHLTACMTYTSRNSIDNNKNLGGNNWVTLILPLKGKNVCAVFKAFQWSMT